MKSYIAPGDTYVIALAQYAGASQIYSLQRECWWRTWSEELELPLPRIELYLLFQGGTVTIMGIVIY